MLFFGAGASAPFGIPTTPILTKETVDLLNAKSQSLLEQIEQSHKDQWHVEPNYEEILGYLTAYASPSELRNDDYRLSFAERNPKFRSEQKIRDLIDEIHQIICNYCNQPFIKGTDKYLKPDELEFKFQVTYDTIIGTYLSYEQSPVIFSTNYDPSLEIWCLKRNIECVDGTQKTFNIEVNRMLDEAKHKEAIEHASKKDVSGISSDYTAQYGHMKLRKTYALNLQHPQTYVCFQTSTKRHYKESHLLFFLVKKTT